MKESTESTDGRGKNNLHQQSVGVEMQMEFLCSHYSLKWNGEREKMSIVKGIIGSKTTMDYLWAQKCAFL